MPAAAEAVQGAEVVAAAEAVPHFGFQPAFLLCFGPLNAYKKNTQLTVTVFFS